MEKIFSTPGEPTFHRISLSLKNITGSTTEMYHVDRPLPAACDRPGRTSGRNATKPTPMGVPVQLTRMSDLQMAIAKRTVPAASAKRRRPRCPAVLPDSRIEEKTDAGDHERK
jgi:hypothetical protein